MNERQLRNRLILIYDNINSCKNEIDSLNNLLELFQKEYEIITHNLERLLDLKS